jgi:hypothetical protein
MAMPNYALQRTGSALARARVRARLICWHGRTLDALRPAAERGR